MNNVYDHIDRLEERLNERLTRIEAKVDLTNGRVGALENWRAELRGARRGVTLVGTLVSAAVAGAVSVASLLFG